MPRLPCCSERRAATADPHPHRTLAHAEQHGNLGIREAGDEVQQQWRALLLRHARKCRLDLGGFDRTAFGRRLVVRAQRQPADQTLSAQMRARQVVRDAEQPGTQERRVKQPGERLVGTQKCVLHQIAGLLGIADEAAQVVEQRRLVARHQQLERVRVAFP
jgi:hypothetical protein